MSSWQVARWWLRLILTAWTIREPGDPDDTTAPRTGVSRCTWWAGGRAVPQYDVASTQMTVLTLRRTAPMCGITRPNRSWCWPIDQRIVNGETRYCAKPVLDGSPGHADLLDEERPTGTCAAIAATSGQYVWGGRTALEPIHGFRIPAPGKGYNAYASRQRTCLRAGQCTQDQAAARALGVAIQPGDKVWPTVAGRMAVETSLFENILPCKPSLD